MLSGVSACVTHVKAPASDSDGTMSVVCINTVTKMNKNESLLYNIIYRRQMKMITESKGAYILTFYFP